jgi:hypothetical protein
MSSLAMSTRSLPVIIAPTRGSNVYEAMLCADELL